MAVVLLFSTLMLLVLQVSHGQFICPQVTKSDLPPDIPTSYSYWATVNTNGSDAETFIMHETYNENFFGSFRMIRGLGNSSTHETSKYFDFKQMQAFYIDENNETCVTTNLTSMTNQSIFAMGIENGLQAVTYFYNWHNKTLNYTLNKTDTPPINGIPCQHYNTCLTFDKGNIMYKVDLYISKYGYELPHGQGMPIQLILTTYEKDKTPLLYTFTFNSFSNSEDNFQFAASSPPHGIYCPDRKFVPDVPPTPEHYSVVSEIEHKESKTVITTHTWLYFEHKLYRRDSIEFGKPKSHNQVSVIHDYREGLMYTIDKNRGNCSVNALNHTVMFDFDITVNSTTHKIQMADPVQFMDTLHLKYTGRMHSMHGHRGIPMDTWKSDPIIKANFTMNFTYLFSTPEWKTSLGISPIMLGSHFSLSGFDSDANPINTSMSIRYSDISWTPDLSDDPYDVSPCFSDNQRKTYCLKFANLNDHVLNHPNLFRYKLKSAVASAAKVSLTRISSSVILQTDEDGKYIYAWVTLFDVPKFHGDTTEYEPQENLTVVVNNLKKAVTSNLMTVQYLDEETNKTMVVTAFNNYFVSTEEFYAGNVIHDTGISLSTAAVAGLCVGMLLLGIILGVVIHLLKVKRAASGQFGYSSQN